MCGLAGFLTLSPPSDADSVLERMTSAIHHRGPDDTGRYSRAPAFLGHRRLSIVDLSGGHQPMFNEDGSSVIVFNGEIYNHAELRPELERAGHTYRTRSDTETILHAWEEYGAESLDRLRGMFSFAIWDQRDRRFYAARDRLGIKPFYYYWDGRTFVFGSEIKALLEHPSVEASPADEHIAEYLASGYVSGEPTLFRGIRKLLPGCWLQWWIQEDGTPALSVQRYWDLPRREGLGQRSDLDWIDEVRRRLEESVRLRLMADVPLGTFLSGGVDSSAVTALVQSMAFGRVETFSVGYREGAYSELSYAAQVAERLGTTHREVVVGRDDFFDALPGLIWHEDEPIAWPSSVSLYFVSRLAARHVKVVLTGEGADELFGGYERYRWNILNARIASVYGVVPGSVRRLVRKLVERSPLLGADVRRKLRHTPLGRSLDLESLFLDNFYAAFSAEELQTLCSGDVPGLYDHYLERWRAREGESLLGRMLYADAGTYLIELLMKQDQMSMAASIESRVPFLDQEFASFVTRMPDRMKVRGREQKYALKRAVEGLLPRDIVHRKKMGFPTPIRSWLRDSRSDELLGRLLDSRAFIRRWIRPDAVENLVHAHKKGLQDGTDRIWRLLNLEIWGELFFTGNGSHLPEAVARLEQAVT